MLPNNKNARQGQEQRPDFDPKLLASFRGLTLEDLDKLPATQWLVEGWLPQDVLANLYAAPETGKTFLALDWALCLSTGTQWLTHAVRPARVLYVYTENPRGLPKRLEAWFAEHGEHLRPLAAANFRVVTKRVNLRDGRERAHFIRAHCEFQPQLIVIDTLANCFGRGGNENHTPDMNEFVAGCEELCEWFPAATVLILHHPGKNEDRGARGSNALEAAVSTEFHLTRRGNKLTLENSKQRDGEHPQPLSLQLAPMAESCVVRLAGEADAKANGKAKARPEDKILAVLVGLGEATEKEWREATDASRTTFDRHRDKLLAAGRVSLGDDGLFRAGATEPFPRPPARPMTQIVPPPARTATPSPLSEEHEEAIARLILWGGRGAGLYTGPGGVVEDWVETEDTLASEVSELGCPELVEHVAETGRWRATA